MATQWTNSGSRVVELSDTDRAAELVEMRDRWDTKSARDRATYGYDPGAYAVEPDPDPGVIAAPDPLAHQRPEMVAAWYAETPQATARGGASLRTNNADSEVVRSARGQVLAVGGVHANGQPVRSRHDVLDDTLSTQMGLDPDGDQLVYRRNPNSYESQAAAKLYAEQYGLR